MNRLILSLFLFVSVFSANAQGNYYADALKFNGDVKAVKIYSTSPGKTSIKDAFSKTTIKYDNIKQTRDIVVYTSGREKASIKHKLIQNVNDPKHIVLYTDVLAILTSYTVQYDKEGNTIAIDNGYFNRGKKVLSSFDEQKRVRQEDYYSDGKLTKTVYYTYNADNTITRTIALESGAILSTHRTTYDTHGNPVKIEWEYFEDNKGNAPQKSTDTFVYTYDTKGNYTTCTYLYNGKIDRIQHRDITYR